MSVLIVFSKCNSFPPVLVGFWPTEPLSLGETSSPGLSYPSFGPTPALKRCSSLGYTDLHRTLLNVFMLRSGSTYLMVFTSYEISVQYLVNEAYYTTYLVLVLVVYIGH